MSALARAAHERQVPFVSLVDAKAAGELLGVPPSWLLARARAGRIPHHRLGHYVRFNPAELVRWLDQNRTRARAREDEGPR